MPYRDGNPTLTEQLEEDERRRFYTDDLLKEVHEMARQLAALREAGQRFVDGELSVDGFEAALTDAYDEASEYRRVPGLLKALERIARGRMDNGRPLGGETARQIARETLIERGSDWSKPEPEDAG